MPAAAWKKKPLLFVAAAGLALGGIWLLTNRPIRHGPGAVAMEQPVQTALKKGEASDIQLEGYNLRLLAKYHIRARVLARADYHFGREADLSPTDLALGWNLMSDETVLDELSISQSGRFYFWYASRLPVLRQTIEHNSANCHIIPADAEVAAALDEVRVGHVVTIDGYLVRATGTGGWSWQSSLRRDDTGDGSCEVIYAQKLELEP